MDEQSCEMRDRQVWAPVTIEEALQRRGERMRCPECRGEVKAFRAYNTGTRAHFEHKQRHTGCSTKPRSFDGRSTRHPLAIS